MSSIEKIKQELSGLGYKPTDMKTSQGETVVISYKITIGKYAGKTVRLGFSLQQPENYPEYPPHWIHIHPPYNDGLGGAAEPSKYNDQGIEKDWLSLSRPPTDIWDTLPTKHMSAYLSLHVTRFCKNLK